MSKQRLDLLLVERNLMETREKAKRNIMAGLVFSENHRLDKPGMKVDHDIPLTVKGKLIPYVGRGGLKLEDRKSTRLNSSHVAISYAVFCLKKKKTQCVVS